MSKESKEGLNIGEALTKAGAVVEQPAVEDEGPSKVELLRRLAALESKVVELKEENERIANEATAVSGKRYSPNEKAFSGVEGYEFLVTPAPKPEDAEMYSHLKPIKVKACDESEALRWYCVANEMKPGTGVAVDPLKVRLKVEAVGRKRADSIMRQKQISALRKKVEAGLTLTAKENELLATCEKEIFNY